MLNPADKPREARASDAVVAIKPSPCRPLHFSTEQLSIADRVPMYREVLGRELLRMDVEPVADDPFRVDLSIHPFPGLTVMSATTYAMRGQRTRELTSDGVDTVGLVVNLRGPYTDSRRDAEVSLAPGDAIFISAAEPRRSFRPYYGRMVGLNIRRAALSGLIPHIDDRLSQVVPRSDAVLGLLTSYLSALTDTRAQTGALREFAATHVCDLFTLMLGASLDVARLAEARGAAAARLHAIKTDILKNLDSRNLTLGALAARHRVTPRYIQRLFERDSTSLTQFVLDERLARAHRLLRGARDAQRSISEIAFAVGFGDLSYFNRSFRRRYGMTPSDVRALAADETGTGA